MPMTLNGLAKLSEELGELQQVVAKKMACMDTDEHWDGAGSLKKRMEDECADVIAAIKFVEERFGLDITVMTERAQMKLNRFREWHADPNN